MPRRPEYGRRPPAPSRPTAAARGYGKAWQTARMLFLQAHPLCVKCLSGQGGQEGARRVESATVVDHIVPHRGDMTLFWDEDNWQSLCTPCHNRKTAQENRASGRW